MKHFLMGCMIICILCMQTGSIKAATADDVIDELDISELNRFLEDREEMPVTFEDVLRALVDTKEIPYEKLGDYIKDRICMQFQENKALILKLLIISVAFSLLKNYAKEFSCSYVSEICFFLCYCFMMILLLQSFSVMNETVLKTTDDMVAFMKVLIPVYCGAISFTLNFNASAATYSIIFAAIYLVEWMMRYLLVPFVKIYVILEFLNHLMEEERFKRLAELIASAVKVLLKIAVSFVLGMNIIQGMIAPAMDKLAENTITKTMQMIPVIGNVMSGMGQIFLTSGLMIKNCLGATALVILVILCAVPFLKMAVLAVLYKFLAAVLEPIADKRLSGGMNGIANGGMLYLKIISTCLMMFFLSIALSSAATGLGG